MSHINQNDRRSILLTGEALGLPKRPTKIPELPGRPRQRQGGAPKGPMKALTPEQLKRVIEYARTAYDPPEAAVLKIALGFCAGARACEMARLRMRDVTDADGNIDAVIRITKRVGKKGKEREVPMDPFLRDALIGYRKRFPGIDHLTTAYRDGKWQNAGCVTSWFYNLFKRLHMDSCGSHSGRKTFATNAAKAAQRCEMTLRDVQELLGHEKLNTTQAYIAVSPNHAKLVRAISVSQLFDGPEGGE
jgi:integrase/recombinase XerD